MGANQPGQKFQARRPRSGQKEPANLIVNALKIGNTRFSGKRLRRRFKRGIIPVEISLFMNCVNYTIPMLTLPVGKFVELDGDEPAVRLLE